jgi:competence ComEA-like helix-hairpin-helix protein
MAKRATNPIAAGNNPRLEAVQSLGFLVAVCVCIVLSLSFLAGIRHQESGSASVQPDERINPNDAPVASLARLPGIGLTRARAIVALREHLREREGGGPAFRSADDLQQVKGIGPATVEGIRPWLRFDPPLDSIDEPPAR